MARTKSIHTEGRVTSLSVLADTRGRIIIGICLIGMVFSRPMISTAASGPGIGIKAGVQTLDDPIDPGKTTRARFELELSTARFYDDHFDFAFTFGGSSLGSFSTYYADIVDGALIEEEYDDHLSVLDARVAARFYPLGGASEIRPYVGAGVGYFWFLDRWDYDYAETFEDPDFPGTFYTFIDDDSGTDTAARGFFPFITAGVTIPLGGQGELLFDFQYDFEKKDNGFDLGGPIYMIGARFRF